MQEQTIQNQATPAQGAIYAAPHPDIDLWVVCLKASADAAERCYATLSQDEKDRAARFRFAPHRQNYVLGRAILRILIGRYLSIRPAAVTFSYGANGKPALLDSSSPIRFNSSHSGNTALYAFTQNGELGVDIEQIRPVEYIEEIADRFFCREEARELRSLPPSQRLTAFFRCWTRKEAYVKAVGGGLSIRLDSFRVTLLPRDRPALIGIENSTRYAEPWTIHDVRTVTGFAAALAYPGNPRSLNENPPVQVDNIFAILEQDSR